ncbi:MAG TPA: Sir2 family NAD-dependent protein deacetylase [Geobacteraceae bacterium]|nr:Sir2 family NAD-dependent protein deacetylase [Geobacteraceae bacterium]
MLEKAVFGRAADAIGKSRSLIITAGAGMGVDSGLPDFRGPRGFWRAYPAYEKIGISFVEAANPRHFESDPSFGWGFYGHRLNMYRETVPHPGFSLLLKWIDSFGLNSFVVTSNVDGHFRKAGFDSMRILEVHGSIHFLQCTRPCGRTIWENHEEIPVDISTMHARRVPMCAACGAHARPNILMFGDYSWISDRTDAQHDAFETFLRNDCPAPLTIIEIGAGTAIPTIRNLSESLGTKFGATVIRINPGEPQIQLPQMALECSALDGLRGIDSALSGMEL